MGKLYFLDRSSLFCPLLLLILLQPFSLLFSVNEALWFVCPVLPSSTLDWFQLHFMLDLSFDCLVKPLAI